MIKSIVKKSFQMVGLNVTKNVQPTETNAAASSEFPQDFEDVYIDVIKKVRPFTLTTNENLYQLIYCVKYLVENRIAGDFVECGVWRGGSILTIIETLKLLKASDRTFHLFDTFSSDDMFSTKSAIDDDAPLNSTLEEAAQAIVDNKIDLSVNLADVKELMRQSEYPTEKIVFHVGRVEDTIPISTIDRISLLRLDTDWYDSTKFQLEHLYEKVVPNGVIICDDYGYWKGHKKAVDEFLVENNLKPLLIRNDWSCRFFIKNV